MKRITTILLCLLCTITMMAEGHMKFRTLSIDGDLKTAIKQVKKWGLMGMKIKNVAAMMGTLDGEDVILALIATPETNTLFSVSIVYEGSDQWSEQLAKYQDINAKLAAQYGEPTKVIDQWEEPYSIDNNPIQAFQEEKAVYSSTYTTSEGYVSINLMYTDGKICTAVAYVDEQNSALYIAEGGREVTFEEYETEEMTIEE